MGFWSSDNLLYFDFMAKRVQITPVLSTNNVLYLTKSYKAIGYLTQTERFFLLQARAIVRTSSFWFCSLSWYWTTLFELLAFKLYKTYTHTKHTHTITQFAFDLDFGLRKNYSERKAYEPVASRCIIPVPLQRHWNNASIRLQLGRIASALRNAWITPY